VIALLLALLAQQPAPQQPAHTSRRPVQQAPSIAPAPAPAAPVPAPAPAPEPPKVQPWQGTLAAGRAELQKLSNEGEHDQAAALAARVLAMPDWDRQSEVRRAEALFDIGVALGVAKAVEPAAEAFHKARGLAGSQPLGLDAIYDAGTFRLQGAEALRLEIPEVREKLKLPPLQPQQPQPAMPSAPGQAAPGQASQGGEPAPDALEVARGAYVAAREDLVERLRADARDRDTRANLELIQRRLRELDELQKKREEEQQQKQEQQENDPQQKDQQDKQDPKDQQKQDPQQNQDPQKQDQEQQDEQQQDEQPKPEEQKQDEEKPAEPDPKDVKEMQLSPEEIVRLLDQLQKIEEQAEQVRAQLRERRRVPVKKDW
jgi:hypothetical protein